MKISWFLVGIVVLASILRIWGLDRVAPELFSDELDVGYQAYSILKTGRDYSGQLLPTYIHSFIEWRAPLLIYATVPFVAVFGLNEWGVRLPSALFGIISILFLYLLVRVTIKKERIALLSAFILAISPWHIQYSRAGFEVNLLLMLVLVGAYLFITGLSDKKRIIFSAIFFALTFYTYSIANIFIPLFLILLVILYQKNLKTKSALILAFIVFVIFSLPIGYHTIFGKAGERFKSLSVFTDQESIDQINRFRVLEDNTLVSKIFHNKPVLWARKIIKNYAMAFSPQFLFIEGDITLRHSIHEVGEFFWIEMPYVLLGLILFIITRNKSSLFWLGWLLIAPIGSSLTRDGGWHASRLSLMLPPLVVAIGTGINHIIERKSNYKKIVYALSAMILIIEFGFYLHRYWIEYPADSWQWWHVGFKEAMLFMQQNDKNYEIIVFNNTYEPSLIRFAFWWSIDPIEIQNKFNNLMIAKNILPAFDGFSFSGKYYFGTVNKREVEIKNFIKENMLYMVSQRDEILGQDWVKNPPYEVKVLNTIKNPYGAPIFYIVSKNL